MEGGLQCSSGRPHNREYMDITESTWWFIKKNRRYKTEDGEEIESIS